MIDLNKTQLEAVKIRGTNVVVFASAGAGKTTVLVRRLLERITIDKIPLNNILAMTFTEAAAGNMKNRLRNELGKKRQEALKLQDTNELAFIDEQLSGIENTDISTIHSFCLKIVKKYYYRLGLTQKTLTNILSGAQSEEICDELLDKIIEEELAKDQRRLIELTEAISSEIFAFSILKKTILAIYEAAMNKKDPLSWLKSEKGHPEIKCLSELKEYDAIYLKKVKRLVKRISNLYRKASLLDDSIDPKEYEAIASNFDSLLAFDDYETFIEKAQSMIIPFTKRTKCKDPEFKAVNEKIAGLYKDLAKILVDPDIMVKVENDSIKYIDYLIDLTIAFYERFRAYKIENEWIDFSDFEHYAYEILTHDDHKIAKELKGQYKEIMIDEFQDTNEIQFAIAELLSADDLFIVGDIKQSIYRFRSAKPYLMRSLRERPDFKVIDIRENYRSKANIVAFDNAFFSDLMNIDDEAFKEIDKQIAPTDSQAKDQEAIEFVYYEPNENSPKELNARADLLAQEVLRVHDEGTSFSKMCVLVRSNNDKIKVKRAFDKANIPYFISDKEGHLSSYPIDVLSCVLDLISDHSDKLALVGVLMGLYDYSEDDIAKMRDDLMIKGEVAKDIDALDKSAKANDIDGFFSYLLSINGFYDKLSTSEKTNLDYLISKLDTYDLKSFIDLSFVLANRQDKDSDTAFAVSDEADVVKVMTIHASKGLEFDTVFLYSQHELKAKDATDVVVIDDELGIGLKYSINKYRLTYETYRRKAIRIKNDQEEMREYLRLLYVALTRTIKKLIVIDAFKEGDFSKLRVIEKEDLIEEHKGFSSYFLTLSFPDDMVFRHESTLTHPHFESVTDTTSQKTLHYKKEDSTKAIITPSKHDTKIELSLEENMGTSYGTKVHRVMELIDLKDMDEEKIKMIDDSLSEKTISQILKIKDDPVFKEVLNGEIYKEVPFYRNDDVYIEGIIDLTSILDDKVILVDYKTDNVESGEILIDRYRDQIMIYKDILAKVYHKPVMAYIYSFHLLKMVPVL